MSSQILPPARSVRNARIGVIALFFTNGALFANFVPRFPEVKDALELTASGYGILLAAFPLGAILGGPLAAWFIRRFASARVAVWGTVLIGLFLFLGALLIALAETTHVTNALIVTFGILFGIAGAADAIVDVGQNTHGLRVQRLYGRSIINSFHAAWSLGAMSGGLMAMGASALELPIEVHIGISGLVFALVGLIARRFTLPGPDRSVDEDAANGHRVHVKNWSTPLALTLLVMLAIAGTMVEDINQSWATLYMRDFLHVSTTWAPSAFVLMLAFQFIGRATGDWFIDRLGAKRTIQLGGAMIAVGMSFAVFIHHPAVTVLAFAFAGLGCATTVPIAMNAADDIPGLREGSGLTILSWLMRFSFLLVPPVLGQVVNATSLVAPIVVLPFVGIAIMATTVVLADQRANQPNV